MDSGEGDSESGKPIDSGDGNSKSASGSRDNEDNRDPLSIDAAETQVKVVSISDETLATEIVVGDDNQDQFIDAVKVTQDQQSKEAIQMGSVLIALSKSNAGTKEVPKETQGSRAEPISLINDTPSKPLSIKPTSKENPIDVDQPVRVNLAEVYTFSAWTEFVKVNNAEGRHSLKGDEEQFASHPLQHASCILVLSI